MGECGLCRQSRELQKSHLIPRAGYRHLRGSKIGVQWDPVFTTPTKARITTDQATAPFLCSDCEQRFQKRGEDLILRQCAQQNGEFKLRDQLQAAAPLHTEGRSAVYNAAPPSGRALDSYLYFAASVFWRSAACRRWRMGGDPVASISLGATYQEQFRLYLLDEGPFPADARITLHVATESDLDVLLMLGFPSTSLLTDVCCYDFFINGLLFLLFLGNAVTSRHDDKALRLMCNYRAGCGILGL
jgi:hypothetical protein